MKITQPPFLKIGDTIGLVCPSGFMDAERVQTCIRTLERRGYHVKTGQTIGGKSTTYFSGTDEERLQDLQQMLDDDTVKAILCARGGYGMTRIIDAIDFRRFRKSPKWIIGFSDITLLLNHVFAKYNTAGIHGPMAAAFNDNGYRNKYTRSLLETLEGEKANYSTAPYKLNRVGEASGTLVGGNLSLVINAIGTPSDIKTKGNILLLEDIGEQKYSIDKMLRQLKRCGKLKNLAGLVFGHFSDVGDTTRPFGQEMEDLLWEIVKEYDYPVCFRFPAGHEKENYAVKIGGTYRLIVDKSSVKLIEL